MSRRSILISLVSVCLVVMAAASNAGAATEASLSPPDPVGVRPMTRAMAVPGQHERFSPSFEGTASAPTSLQLATGEGSVPSIERGIESVIGTDGRTQVSDTTLYPARAIGQLSFMQNGSAYICTGWLIDSNTVLSSGHCAYDPVNPGGDMIESSVFAPGRNGGTDPFGTCNVVQVYAPDAWKSYGLATDDWSLQQLDCTIGDTVGWLGYAWFKGSDALEGMGVTVQGYPGDKPSGTQWTMSGKISYSDKKMGYYKMDTYGGQSGSPVFDPHVRHCGVCGLVVHSYGVPPGAHKPYNANSGPRITKSRFNLIQSLAAANDPP